jgi:hypothetical protein
MTKKLHSAGRGRFAHESVGSASCRTTIGRATNILCLPTGRLTRNIFTGVLHVPTPPRQVSRQKSHPYHWLSICPPKCKSLCCNRSTQPFLLTSHMRYGLEHLEDVHFEGVNAVTTQGVLQPWKEVGGSAAALVCQ